MRRCDEPPAIKRDLLRRDVMELRVQRLLHRKSEKKSHCGTLQICEERAFKRCQKHCFHEVRNRPGAKFEGLFKSSYSTEKCVIRHQARFTWH